MTDWCACHRSDWNARPVARALSLSLSVCVCVGARPVSAVHDIFTWKSKIVWSSWRCFFLWLSSCMSVRKRHKARLPKLRTAPLHRLFFVFVHSRLAVPIISSSDGIFLVCFCCVLKVDSFLINTGDNSWKRWEGCLLLLSVFDISTLLNCWPRVRFPIPVLLLKPDVFFFFPRLLPVAAVEGKTKQLKNQKW